MLVTVCVCIDGCLFGLNCNFFDTVGINIFLIVIVYVYLTSNQSVEASGDIM